MEVVNASLNAALNAAAMLGGACAYWLFRLPPWAAFSVIAALLVWGVRFTFRWLRRSIRLLMP